MKTRTLKPAGQVTINTQPGTDEPREMVSETLPPDGYSVAQAVVLKRSSRAGEWVTRRRDMDTGAEFWGHYFPAIDDKGGEVGAFRRAYRDYVRRCAELGVNPSPKPLLPPLAAAHAGGAGVLCYRAGQTMPAQIIG